MSHIKLNLGKTVDLNEFEAEAVASLVKLYLRELPDNILTPELLPKFTELSSKYLLPTVLSLSFIIHFM